jgi:histidine triad (HIT) family protein
MVESTIFTKIINREIPSDIVFESEEVLAFRDINPQAPTHILIIPKKPLKDVLAAGPDDAEVLGALLLAAGQIVRSLGLEDEGFRLVVNNGATAGQTVFHLHVHLLAGREFRWPPG